MVVKVYRNLHKDCFSVVDCKTNRVAKHVESIMIDTPIFHVSQAGRTRVLQTKTKNVHAWIKGEELSTSGLPRISHLEKYWEEVVYDPYKYSSFVDKQGKEIKTASVAIMQEKRVFIPKEIIIDPELANRILTSSLSLEEALQELTIRKES